MIISYNWSFKVLKGWRSSSKYLKYRGIYPSVSKLLIKSITTRSKFYDFYNFNKWIYENVLRGKCVDFIWPPCQCHIRSIFLMYPRSIHRYERVGISGIEFGIITKKLLTIEIEGKIVIFFPLNWMTLDFLEKRECHMCGWDEKGRSERRDKGRGLPNQKGEQGRKWGKGEGENRPNPVSPPKLPTWPSHISFIRTPFWVILVSMESPWWSLHLYSVRFPNLFSYFSSSIVTNAHDLSNGFNLFFGGSGELHRRWPPPKYFSQLQEQGPSLGWGIRVCFGDESATTQIKGFRRVWMKLGHFPAELDSATSADHSWCLDVYAREW